MYAGRVLYGYKTASVSSMWCHSGHKHSTKTVYPKALIGIPAKEAL